MKWRTWPQEKPMTKGGYVGRVGEHLRWIYLDPADVERIFYFQDVDLNLPVDERSTMTFQWLDESPDSPESVRGIHPVAM